MPVDFPGWAPQAGNHDTAARCDRLEQNLKNDIDDWRFSPYIQRHEFEALVFAAQDFLGDLSDADDQLSGLARLRSEVAGMPPGGINDSAVMAPSKRLLRQISRYCKSEDRPHAIELAGLSSVRDQCPRFDAWLTGLELWGTFEQSEVHRPNSLGWSHRKPPPVTATVSLPSPDPAALASAARPDLVGRFGPYGGQYVPETLMPALAELEAAAAEAWADPAFIARLDHLLRTYVGRPTPLYEAERLSEHYRRPEGGPRLWLKREDLNHTGAHKINNALGQALLALRMGKQRIIAETGAGQHGVATATVCARFGLECVIYMGAEDMRRQALNVFRMRLLGAKVQPVTAGTATLKDATSEAIRDWVTNVETTHYILGSVAGPHPYPMLVRDFHAVIGQEARGQCLEAFGRLPDVLIACVGGGSNAMGLFHPFVEDTSVRLIGVEAAGEGVATGRHAATITEGRVGVLHGAMSLLLQDDDGQVQEAHSISAGLDYPGVGPEHSYLRQIGRAEYAAVTDAEALAALQRVSELEGIIPALETAHAFAWLDSLCPTLAPGTEVVLNLSGRGDKDVNTVAEKLGDGLAG